MRSDCQPMRGPGPVTSTITAVRMDCRDQHLMENRRLVMGGRGGLQAKTNSGVLTRAHKSPLTRKHSDEIKLEVSCVMSDLAGATIERREKLGFPSRTIKYGGIIQQWELCCAIWHALCCSRVRPAEACSVPDHSSAQTRKYFQIQLKNKLRARSHKENPNWINVYLILNNPHVCRFLLLQQKGTVGVAINI